MAGSSGIICFKKRSATAWTLALQTFGKIGARYTQDLRHRLHREPSCGNKICRDIGFLTGLWKASRRIWFSNVLRPRMCSSSRTGSSSFFTSALPITGSSESTAPPHLLAQEPAPTIRLEDMCGRLRARKKNLWRMASSLVRTCVAAAEHRPQPYGLRELSPLQVYVLIALIVNLLSRALLQTRRPYDPQTIRAERDFVRLPACRCLHALGSPRRYAPFYSLVLRSRAWAAFDEDAGQPRAWPNFAASNPGHNSARAHNQKASEFALLFLLFVQTVAFLRLIVPVA